MTLSTRTPLAVAALLLLGASPPPPASFHAADVSCSQLGSVGWSGFSVDVAEGRPASAGTPAHCFIRGTIDTEIHFELLLPLPDAWNSRFLMGGGGGFVGSVQNQSLQFAPTALADGFATVGTDTGHSGSAIDASWALGRPDREINFGHRAVHLTAETAKTIIRLHYARDIDYSYFMGCSRGGGQAMMESQRFPDDFDGIVAGAPAFDWPGLGAQFIQGQQAMYPNPDDRSVPVVTPELRQLLKSAILEECDHLDGVTDGVLTDPRDCGFQPTDLPRCADGDTGGGCITSEQLRAVQAIYGGATASGEKIFPGFPFGGEAEGGGWDQWITGTGNALGPGTPNAHFAFGTQMYKYIIFDDPEWDYSSYDFSTWAKDRRRAAQILSATETDLTPFEVAGGKLILWHGWSDAGLTPLKTIEYFEAVEEANADASSFVRLFLMPGVLHCAGGPGPDLVEWLPALQRWVEDGEAPTQLTATKLGADRQVEMQRPICAYPARAVHDGAGDAKREDSFECAVRSGGGGSGGP